MTPQTANKPYVSTRNACKLCAPLGASLVFKGIEGCVPLIHGSQGCATYIRRYMISHFKEPVDIASSNFSEETTVYGGSRNFITGIENIITQYKPAVIGIASTCLSETIGEDIPGHIRRFNELHAESDGNVPTFIHTSTPSYAGSHAEGFHNTVLATVKTLSTFSRHEDVLGLLPGMVSPADLRYLKEILDDFKQEAIVFPDYSETLDNGYTAEYQLIPSGGTPIASIRRLGNAKAVIQLGTSFNKLPGKNREGAVHTAGEWLESSHYVSLYSLPLPIGIEATDAFLSILVKASGKPQPEKYVRERGRLLDAYVDAHKYVFGKRVLIYGEPDLVDALANWTREIGMEPFAFEGADFETMREHCETIKPDLLLGNSKGYYIARERDIPLVRLGFPIHDRMGANRIEHLGYRGTQQLFDRVVNALLAYKQDHSPIGYKYL